MIKKIQKIITVLIMIITVNANSQTRYLDEIFTEVVVTELDTFALNVSIEPLLFGMSPMLMPIECDIYSPLGNIGANGIILDSVTDRPVIIVSHTGSFLPPVANGQATGSIKDSSIVEQCIRWAKKGYVAIAMGNRKGWNPTSTDQNVRTSTLLQAAYRGVQDAKAMVRFLRMMTIENNNPFGINTEKIVLGGQGTGAYISLAYATLDDEQELYLPKFMDLTDPTNPVPYVIPQFFGNIDGSNFAYLPLYDTVGNVIGIDSSSPTNIPNYPQYSNDISMAFNLGGALADISWLDSTGIPIVSFHCENDPYAPIDTGDVIVPTTGDFVVEVMGSRTIQHYANLYGHNDVFINAGFNDVFTNNANINNNGYEGLYIFKTPTPSTQPNLFGEFYEEEASPWDWWNLSVYDTMFAAINGAPAGYGSANSILGNPNMSGTKGRDYIDTVQGYLNPRIYVALNLGGTSSLNDVFNYSTKIYPNPAKNTLTIENLNFLIQEVKLYNITGQIIDVIEFNSMKKTISLQNYERGIYIIEIKSNNTSIKKKLIIE
tara:strand:+ start:2713 stop:4347 length:1635 start_codon:yes stop_codon:yes gene_type:complete